MMAILRKKMFLEEGINPFTGEEIESRVRVAGMDAPEKGQPYGKLATYQLSKLLEGEKVKIRSIGEGRVCRD